MFPTPFSVIENYFDYFSLLYTHFTVLHCIRIRSKLLDNLYETHPHNSLHTEGYLSIYISLYLSVYLSMWINKYVWNISYRASLVAQMVKNLSAMQEIWFDLWVRDPLEKGMATTPVFLPGEFHGQRSLDGYSPWGHRVGHNWVTNTFGFVFFHISYIYIFGISRYIHSCVHLYIVGYTHMCSGVSMYCI